MTLPAEDKERIEGVVMSLGTIHAQLGVLSLAMDGLWFPGTDMGKGRRETTGADYNDLHEVIRKLSGDVLWQINELQTLPSFEKDNEATN